MGKLRKKQLHNLADAFKIDYPKDCTKPEILPIMEIAMSRGVFRGEPKDKRKFAMAMGRPSSEWPDCNIY